VRCSATEEPEIFACARVGLGVLGVVTQVTLQCEALARYLQEQGISPTAAVLIAPAKRAKYEPVAAALKSLREAGYKRVGFAPALRAVRPAR